MNISKELFSTRLKIFIKSLKLKQKDFSVKLRITPKHLSQLVRGKANPSDKLLDDLERHYNLNLIWLETGEGEMSITAIPPEEQEKIKRRMKGKTKRDMTTRVRPGVGRVAGPLGEDGQRIKTSVVLSSSPANIPPANRVSFRLVCSV